MAELGFEVYVPAEGESAESVAKNMYSSFLDFVEEVKWWSRNVGNDNIKSVSFDKLSGGSIDLTGAVTIFGEKETTMLDEFGIDVRFLKWYPNKIKNSSFELFDSVTKIPTHWTGTGTSSSSSAWDETYSCKLTPGQTITQTVAAGANPQWWNTISKQTRVSFHKKGGAVTISVLDSSNADAPFTIYKQEGNYGTALEYPYNADWLPQSYSINFTHGSCTKMLVKFENTDSTYDAYVDGIIIEPDYTRKRPSMYTRGPDSIGTTTGASIMSSATASAAIADHSLVRGDGGADHIQGSGITVDDSNNVSGIGTLGVGEITIANGSGLNLQEDISFTGATGENLIIVPNAEVKALVVMDSANEYITLDTTTQKTVFGKPIDAGENTLAVGEVTIASGYGLNLAHEITFTGGSTANKIIMPDNTASALEVKAAESIVYLQYITTTGSEKIKLGVDVEGQGGTFNVAYIGGNIYVGTENTTAGIVTLYGGTSGAVMIRPSAVAGSYYFTLPDNQGNAEQVLSSDGNGNLYWADQTGGTGGSTGDYGETIGDGVNTAFTVTHSMGSRDVNVEVYRMTAPYEMVYPQIEHTTINAVTITFADPPDTNSMRVAITKGGGGDMLKSVYDTDDDGVVDSALNATNATNANYATSAGSADTATTATSATNADHATTADSATTATSADSATTATTADNALSGNGITFPTVGAGDDDKFLQYDHATTAFVMAVASTGGGDYNIDGGDWDDIYTPEQSIDGGAL